MNKLPGFDLVERARALQPLIAREADEIERTRRLTQPVVSALLENGLYRALLPKSLGGAEAPLEIFMQMQEEVAKADASTAWCLGQCSVCAMISAYLDPEPASEIFNVAPGILAWGAIDHAGAGGSRRLQGQRALGFRQRLAAGELARRPCPDRRGRRLAAPQARRLAGDPHHPVPGDQRHDVRRLGRDRPQRHRHRLLFGRGSLHSGAVHRAARRTRGVARARPAVPDPHANGLQHGLWRDLARRRPRHAGCRHRAVARQAAAGAFSRCARTARCRD